MAQLGKLFFFCGKMGAGKSTQASLLAKQYNAVLISEDAWLAAHYPQQINNFDDYINLSRQIKPFIKQHVQLLLATGCAVVMDFPANTRQQRSWFLTLCTELGCQHQLNYLNLSDEQCLSQIAQRRTEQPERAQFDTEAMFYHVSKYFEAPTDEEGLTIVSLASAN
ncbi:AAA family ATPase [Agarivorans sp.]|uniref:AAA family ATPase n=1 Tax=Agarivorans sp. TaxID=1872412 RepID=UPI003D024BFC